MDGQTGQAQLTFAGHIHELRKRLMLPALVFFVGGSVGYLVHKQVIAFLKAPLDQTLYYNSPAGGFNFIMKICFILGITLAIPTLVYNLVSFIEPAVDKFISRKLISMVTLLSLILGMAGAVFAYYVVLPMSLNFFSGIKVDGISPLISADDYLNFALTCILTFILLFQLPLIVLFINHIKPMSPRKLLKYEKYVIVGSFTIALVLPFTYDPLSQFLIALPVIVLYNLSVLFVWMANRGLRKAEKAKTVVDVETKKPKPIEIPAVPVATVTPVVEVAKPVPAPPRLFAPTPKPASAASRKTFSDFSAPSLRPALAPKQKRPVLDVVASPLQTRNFLDLRPSK